MNLTHNIALSDVLPSPTANTAERPITCEEMERMAKRRYQDPKPFREGSWWWINPRKDEFLNGKLHRVRTRMKVCSADIAEREARKIAAELLRPMNQGLETIGSAMRFADYVKNTFKDYLETKSSTTQASYNGTLDKDFPAFGDTPLRYSSLQVLQKYFAGMADKPIGGATVLKIKEVLSSVLANAVLNECLVKNPALHVAIPRSKVVNKHRRKPNLSPEEFNHLLLLIDEPYSTMVYVAVQSGLRVSERLGSSGRMLAVTL